MRVHNFGPGPSTLPLAVLEQAQRELLDFHGSGMSILESSHRGPHYDRVHRRAIEDLKELLGGADDHEVLFMGGGARTQFSAVPMNLLSDGGRAGYLTTGRWSEMALEAAGRYGEAEELWSGRATGYDHVPGPEAYELAPGAEYLHYTSNNTIYGTQFHEVPDAGDTPLVCDMSSDILSRPIDLSPFGAIYAGAQKNLGPAGVTIVLVRRDLLDRSPGDIPEPLSYKAMAAKNSLLNTPPVFAIYMTGLVLGHLLESGGLAAVEKRNRRKAELLYAAIDGSGGYYQGHARPESRSRMNVTFRLPDEEREQLFLAESAAAGLVGLKGHRSVGGVRASLYNALQIRSVEALVEFMAEFQRKHP
jgi:phosphoserine aminotransferase